MRRYGRRALPTAGVSTNSAATGGECSNYQSLVVQVAPPTVTVILAPGMPEAGEIAIDSCAGSATVTEVAVVVLC